LLAAGAAPAVVRASSLMKLASTHPLVVPDRTLLCDVRVSSIARYLERGLQHHIGQPLNVDVMKKDVTELLTLVWHDTLADLNNRATFEGYVKRPGTRWNHVALIREPTVEILLLDGAEVHSSIREAGA